MPPILPHRLAHQALLNNAPQSAEAIVAHLGAVQAQDYPMSKLALGVRQPNLNDLDITAAIDDGRIIRTHILRPTWHLVAAEDIHWMLDLTAPHVKRLMGSYNRNLELDEALYSRTNALLENALRQQPNQTRDELAQMLQAAGIDTNKMRMAHIMMNAELDSLVCNGVMRGKEITYDLLDVKVPNAKRLSREEGIYELTHRFFASHGMATLKDFIWWSGLPTRDARDGIANNAHHLLSETIDDKIFWFKNPEPASVSAEQPLIHFLPAFDEFVISYTDRSHLLDPIDSPHIIPSNGMFRPSIMENGRTIGVWKRVQKAKSFEVEYRLFQPGYSIAPEAIEYWTNFFQNHFGLNVIMKKA